MVTLVQSNVLDINNQISYFYYTMPDISGFTKYADQAKPLLNELKTCLENLKDQNEAMYTDKVKVAKLYKDEAKKIDAQTQEKIKNLGQLNQQAINEKDFDIEKLKAEVIKLNSKINKDSEETAAKFALLAKNYSEDKLKTNLEIEQAHKAEKEIRELLVSSNTEKESISEIANKSIEAIRTTKLEVSTLKAELEAIKNKGSSTPAKLSGIEKMNAAFELAMGVLKKPQNKSDSNSVCTIDDEYDSSHESTSTRKQLKIKMNTTLPTFHGRPDSNIDEWLYALSRVLEAGGYSNQEKLAIATNHLRDIASSDYMLHEQRVVTISWNEFKEYMRKKYTPPNHNQIIRNKIKQLKQITSVKDYYIEFRKLAIQAYSMNEDERMSWFTEGLKPSLAKHVYLKECKTIEEAYEQADLCETYSNDRLDTHSSIYYSSNNNSNNNNKQYQSNSSNNHYNFKQQFQPQQQQNSQQQQDSTQNEYVNETCCICLKKGHIGEICRSRINCSTCNMTGHTADLCRQHLYCTTCQRNGHLAQTCFAKKAATTSYMAASANANEIIT